MAKVILSEKARKIDKLSRFIFGAMKSTGTTQEALAETLGIARQTFCRKVKTGTLTYTELWKVFKVLGADEETIISLLK